MAMIIKTFAAIGFVSHWIGSLTRWMFISIELIIPSVANKLLKIMEYATSDVTHGKKIAVLKNPLNFNFLLFNIDEIASAKIIIIGTWIIKYKTVLNNAFLNVSSVNNLL